MLHILSVLHGITAFPLFYTFFQFVRQDRIQISTTQAIKGMELLNIGHMQGMAAFQNLLRADYR